MNIKRTTKTIVTMHVWIVVDTSYTQSVHGFASMKEAQDFVDKQGTNYDNRYTIHPVDIQESVTKSET